MSPKPTHTDTAGGATRATRLRAWLAEGREIGRANFGLTPREREGVLLVIALFVLGLVVKWLRWMLA